MPFLRPLLLTLGVSAIAGGIAQAVSEVPFAGHHAGHMGHVLVLIGMLLVFVAVLTDARRSAGERRSGRKDLHAHR